MHYVYLATGSDPSGVVSATWDSSGPPGGVGRRARRLGRIWPKEPGTGSGRRGTRFPLIGLRSRSLSADAAFLPDCCSARTFKFKICQKINVYRNVAHKIKLGGELGKRLLPSVPPERTLLSLPRKALLDLVHLVALLLQPRWQLQDCDWPCLGTPGRQQIHIPGWLEHRISPHLHL